MPIVYQVRNRAFEDYSPRKKPVYGVVRRKGKLAQDRDGIVELFRISILAEALDRSSDVLTDWENRGLLPQPLYGIEGDQCKRWYSAVQIINCHRIMMGRYGGRKYFQNDKALFAKFFDDLRSVWYATKVVVNEQGETEGDKNGS